MNNNFKPKRGDRVKAWDRNPDLAKELVFLAEIPGAMFPYIVVSPLHERNFENKKPFLATRYSHIEPLNKEPRT